MTMQIHPRMIYFQSSFFSEKFFRLNATIETTRQLIVDKRIPVKFHCQPNARYCENKLVPVSTAQPSQDKILGCTFLLNVWRMYWICETTRKSPARIARNSSTCGTFKKFTVHSR